MLHTALASAADGLCKRWADAAEAGTLPVATIMEASGIALAGKGSRLYHINDGEGPLFYITDAKGGALQSVRISGFMPSDIEDLGRGPCGKDTCLYVADIGDNAVRRQSVQIALIKEVDSFGAEVAPERVITARYPDGPHDAEAIAIHPSGDLFLVTKSRLGQQQNPALVFRLGATQLAAGGEQKFEQVGTLPLIKLSEALGDSPRRIVTAMDISADGKRFVLLTYDAVLEFAVDLKGGLPDSWAEGRTHHAAPIATLLQAESIAYERDGRSILYSTESIRGTAAPLMRQSCAE